MQVESADDALAVSPKGAVGLMQVMPDTRADLRLRYGLDDDPSTAREHSSPAPANLRELHHRYRAPGFLGA